MQPRFLLPLPLVVLLGCQTEPTQLDIADADPGELLRQKGTPGASNGQFDFCDGPTPCESGEGDCDNDGQCAAGLVCVDDVGHNFGQARTTDMCAPAHCDNDQLDAVDGETAVDFGGPCGESCGGSPGNLGFCRPGCECPDGVGDCSVDSDCQAGLVCGQNNGAQYELHWSFDVCVQPSCSNGVLDPGETAVDFGGACGSACSGANGDQEGYCSPGCPCADEEGDCDSDSECEPGLACVNNQGADYGMDPLHDVCLSPSEVTDLEAGDLVITEIMINPVLKGDASAEYFEVFNNTSNTIDLNGLHVHDSLTTPQSFNVTTSVTVGPGEYASLARTANTASNGGFVPDFDYVNTFSFNDNSDSLILQAGVGGTEIDRVVYNTTWTRPAGSSLELSRDEIDNDNNVSTAWCASVTALPSGDNGSPGAQNRICP